MELVIDGVNNKMHKVKNKQGVILSTFYCSSGVEKVGDVLYSFSKSGKLFTYDMQKDDWNCMNIEFSVTPEEKVEIQ